MLTIQTYDNEFYGMQTYSQIYNTSYAFWGGASTLNYTSPVRGFPHSITVFHACLRQLLCQYTNVSSYYACWSCGRVSH